MNCRTNITMPFAGEDITVTLDVDFEVEPPDESVGIMGCGVASFSAKVIGADTEECTPDVLNLLQTHLDANESDWRDEIEDACLESLADPTELYEESHGGES